MELDVDPSKHELLTDVYIYLNVVIATGGVGLDVYPGEHELNGAAPRGGDGPETLGVVVVGQGVVRGLERPRRGCHVCTTTCRRSSL